MKKVKKTKIKVTRWCFGRLFPDDFVLKFLSGEEICREEIGRLLPRPLPEPDTEGIYEVSIKRLK